MSEYQYYEFLAIDRPLTSGEMDALRALSTRAHITPVSFTNEYHWGSFSGDADQLMERFFDAHVYVANWMTAIFMVRLPIEALAKETAEAVTVPCLLDIKPTKTHWIITWSLEESKNHERFGMEDGRGWMARLAPVRDELLRGDVRSLYIGWLAAVTGEMLDDDEMEPLSVDGLGNLTAAQKALAQFLEVDKDLLAGAGVGSPDAPKAEISPQEMDKWIDGLPREEVTAVMKQLLVGKGQQAELTLRNRFAAWRRSLLGDRAETPRRTVGRLRAGADAANKIRHEKQERERKQREIKRRKEREASLNALAQDFPKAWKAVRQNVERGSGLSYDEACRALIDISEAYSLHANPKTFQQEMKKFMAAYMRRKALIQRLVKAGLWEDQ
jgi:hypothetical protein